MGNFKDLVERDLQNVFHNPGEMAEELEFWIDSTRYKGAVILTGEGSKDRSKRFNDHVTSVFQGDLQLFAPLSLLGKVPRKGWQVKIGTKFYTITKVSQEFGEVILTLEVRSE